MVQCTWLHRWLIETYLRLFEDLQYSHKLNFLKWSQKKIKQWNEQIGIEKRACYHTGDERRCESEEEYNNFKTSFILKQWQHISLWLKVDIIESILINDSKLRWMDKYSIQNVK